ncbi:Mitochondrial import inner membrane translocase subunit TIM50, partial [Lachnellula suecica]
MLSRAVSRLVQAPGRTATPASLRIPSTSQVWSRSMARYNKPNQNQNKPMQYGKTQGNNQASKPINASVAAGGPAQSSSKSGKPDFSKKQEEVSEKASPERNTTPQSEGTGAGSINSNPRKGEDAAYSPKQSEFDTTASPSKNTAPQSTSPSAVDPAEAQIPNRPLPDLREGIPSTWAFEQAAANEKSNPSLNLTEADGGTPGRGKGDLPASAYISSTERNRNKRFTYGYLFAGGALVAGTLYLGRNWESPELAQEHPDAPQGMTPGLMWGRARARYNDLFNYYQAPAFTKLLPDPDPAFERPYTLVLSLEDLLIKSEWSREHGWRLAKRPGVDYFVRYLSQYYELVIFTSQPFAMGEPVIRKLDPFHIIQWPLFREATLYKPDENEYVKDLAYLNRDLSKVIIMDTKAAHVQNQPENAIVLKPWEGNADDKELISFIPFLEYIHTMAYQDVRKALKSFEGKHIPTEFAQREAVARKKFEEEFASKKRPKHSGAGFLANALGIKAQNMMADPNEQSAGEAMAQGKMLQDVARERGQKMYEMLEKEIRENGEKWLKEEAAQEALMKEEA